ncbi:MAG: cbb3-type cytochrome oxidase assembly protein CcoS [Flavobacteriaceae bacterium]|nr:cbb3-type cytochrome oxidase assembly protein CcoS [Flavobacteriaceae bacterium]
MSVIYLLIGASLAVALVFLLLFFLSVKNGQFEDTYTPSVRMLFDDKQPNQTITKKTKAKPTSKSK